MVNHKKPEAVERGHVGVSLSALLKILGERMYPSDVVFIRENVQNAIDAVRIQSARENLAPGVLPVKLNISSHCVEVEDWGIGMTKEDLKQYYWNVGYTSKDTLEAREAGCIGQFGIGGFANFGVCREIHVFTAANTNDGIHSVLKKSDLELEKGDFPIELSSIPSHRGTLIRCFPNKSEFDVDAILQYLRRYIEFVPELILVNGKKLSQRDFLPRIEKHKSVTPRSLEKDQIEIVGQIVELANSKVKYRLEKVKLNDCWHDAVGEVKLSPEPLLIYKHKFLISDFHRLDGRQYISGKLDLPFVQPLANRENFDQVTYEVILAIHDCLADVLTQYISERSDLINSYAGTPFTYRIYLDENIDLLGKFKVSLADSSRTTLEALKLRVEREGKRIYYSRVGATPQARAFQSAGNIVVNTVDLDYQTQWSVEKYLKEFCRAITIPNIFPKKIYTLNDLDGNTAFLLEVIRQHVRAKGCPQLEVQACKLEPENNMPFLIDDETNLLYVDITHPLIIAVCSFTDNTQLDIIVDNLLLEMLGASLARLRIKLFDSKGPGLSYFGLEDIRYEVLIDTIDQVEIVTSATNKSWTPGNSNLLLIESKDFPSLNGYYLRIPDPVGKVYGKRIEAETTIELIWYLNIISYIIYHEKNQALQITVTLEKAVVCLDSTNIAGHMTLSQHIRSYPKGKGKANGKAHFIPVPTSLQANLIPSPIPKKVRIGPKLIEVFS